MKKFANISLLFAAFIVFCPALASSQQVNRDLSTDEIIALLRGNTITSPDFGCAYYQDHRNGILISTNGQQREFLWGALENKYLSSGRCGKEGCTVARDGVHVTFTRIGGGYRQSVMVHAGDQCSSKTVRGYPQLPFG